MTASYKHCLIICCNAAIPPVSPVFIEEIAERSPLQKGRLMTIAERLRQEGHQIGWQEGMHEQAIKIALRMLEQGIDRDQCSRPPS